KTVGSLAFGRMGGEEFGVILPMCSEDDARDYVLNLLECIRKALAVSPLTCSAGLAERDGLSYAQQRMWFLWQLDPHSAAYNLPMSVCLNGPLELPLLERAFSALVDRHESLRTTFGQEGDRAFQRVAPPAPVSIRLTDLSALPPE
ncbi:amino acid adenylation, partial [Pseudomonas syringae pv. pisi str. 1704B]